MDAIDVIAASVPPSSAQDVHFNDLNWPETDTPSPRETDISLESTTYASGSVDKIGSSSISVPSSKDYDFDQCALLPPLRARSCVTDIEALTSTAVFSLSGL